MALFQLLVSVNMSKLKPWVSGSFELIRHAEGHLHSGSDFDKRMALVSYDNAIEVSITTYLQLHPKQRDGRVYERKKIEQWLTNFHTKLEFLEEFSGACGKSIEVPIDEIVWYHQLRNELYHSGNGMTPEAHCLEGARRAALWTFSVLFGIDTVSLLNDRGFVASKQSSKEDFALTSRAQFLEKYIKAENAILVALKKTGRLEIQRQRVRLRSGWLLLKNLDSSTPADFDAIIIRATEVRNSIVHGESIGFINHNLVELSRDIERVSTWLVTKYGS